MNVAIYGAGAMGTILGAYMTKAGYDIDLINRNQAHVKALNDAGAKIIGTTEFTQPVTALTPDQMTKTYDIIFLMTKQKYNADIVTFLNDYLAPTGILCTMQNGIPEPKIAKIIGKDRVAGATMSWGATFHGKGISELTSKPSREALTFSVGKYGNVNQALFDHIVTYLSTMGDVTIEDNFIGARYAKLIINAAFSGLSVITGQTFGTIAKNRTSRKVALDIMNECIDVAMKADIKIEPLQGHDITKLMYYTNWFKQQLSLSILPIAMRKHKNIRSGMLRDLKRGRETEILYINGIITDYGKQYNIPTPLNDLVVHLVKEIEQGDRNVQFDNIQLFKTPKIR
ncbi:MAG: ketopantoate reductase family protein [Candidatus Izemoplasma sp.]|nr:ketopantoate reductase family protein [Candidatus Izemoplasma sp.]